jgi:hypothetical protein
MLGNGKKIRFWHDVWIGGCPLKIAFPNIFVICNQQAWTVHRTLEGGLANLSFRRDFEDREANEWLELSQLLEGISLTEDKDLVKWVIEKSGIFTTSMYRELTFSGYANRWLMLVWSSKLPLKIRIFLWQVLNNKIQSATQLKKETGLGQQNARCVAFKRLLTTCSLDVLFLSSVGVFLEMLWPGAPFPFALKICLIFAEGCLTNKLNTTFSSLVAAYGAYC